MSVSVVLLSGKSCKVPLSDCGSLQELRVKAQELLEAPISQLISHQGVLTDEGTLDQDR